MSGSMSVEAVQRTERPDYETLLRRAEDLVPVLRERAAEAEQLRRLPQETMDDLERAQLFPLLLPTRVGGWGYGITEFGQITRTLASGCPATAWVYGFMVGHLCHMVMWMPEEGRQEVLGEKGYDFISLSGGYGGAPSGEAIPVEGGWRVTGQWPYSSGVMNANWTFVSTQVPDPDGGDPAPLNLILRREEFEIKDIWHVAGMAATGSNTLYCNDVFVPERRTWPQYFIRELEDFGAPCPEPAEDGYPVKNLSPKSMFDVLMPGCALGSTEHMLEIFRERMGTRTIAFGAGEQVEHREAQARLGHAATMVRTLRASWERTLEELEELCESNVQPSVDLAAHHRMSPPYECQMARDAVAVMMDGSGSSVYALSNVMQRIQRDVSVIRAHSNMHWDQGMVTGGQALLGLWPFDAMVRV